MSKTEIAAKPAETAKNITTPKWPKRLFWGFLLLNIVLVGFYYQQTDVVDVTKLRLFLLEQHFVLAYIGFIAILVVRGLTLLPGAPFLLLGIYLFSILQVFVAIQIAIFCYCIIINTFTERLNFTIPQKILAYENKIKGHEIPIIFSLCFIPGISINILVYFLSIAKIPLSKILTGIMAGSSITSLIYISLIKGVFISAGAWFGG